MSAADHINWHITQGQRLSNILEGLSDDYFEKTESSRAATAAFTDAMKKSLLKGRKVESDPEPEDETTSHDSSEHSSDSAASSEDEKKKKTSKTKANKNKKRKSTKATNGNVSVEQLLTLLTGMKQNNVAPAADSLIEPPVSSGSIPPPPGLDAADIAAQVVALLKQEEEQSDGKKQAPGKIGTKVAFKRVDQVYDRKIHNYKLKETVQSDPKTDQWDQYVFNVRRQFDTSARYLATFVDIKSKHLRDCLKEVMGEIKGVSLVAEKPAVDPNMLFLYLEEIRGMQERQEAQSKALDNKKKRKTAKLNSQHLKLLVDYLDKDYAQTKEALYPMLEHGTITFEYLWALFKPNEILYSSTYGDDEEPRAFKTVYSRENASMMRGKWYSIEARYLEYDGKNFGMATVNAEIHAFTGSRKISSLSCYPIRYHNNPDKAKQELIDRGKRFVALKGMNYKTYAGMCYVKKEDKVLKVDVHGRIMVDPAIFRRTNPNYPLSAVKPAESEVYANATPVVDENGNTTTSSDGRGQPTPASEDFDQQKQFKVIQNEEGKHVIIEIGSDEAVQVATQDKSTDIFTEEQLLIASSTVVGFSFSEKLWLEFAVSKVGEVSWNSDAFDSLILPDNQKNIVKAMVSSHAFHPSQSIDDIIAGKGKGLVAVLHGGPGLGKTLTVESIADLLRRPLYMVSAGDLGTNSQTLERELQQILDIAHTWGAVLLLDEADVFLEKRSTHDIQRNALVSIFLRLLEYFQGILFLTTNRVDVFDDAFISRIHLSLRYNELTSKAKKSVWKTFITKVQDAEGMRVEDISEKDLDDLSRRGLNGRQIKNIVRAAQALAIHEDVALGLGHIRTVLDVAQTFERDLKGGTGYEDAMRGYT
ncbi:hypothetical protein PMZ80_011223 [Knufia obscura]|uniref:AAA+ ATPase domain-containing protein n=1 Tax=Knufia obscura TaxID=1635080 RepID=A0ABR0R7C4_9EURO|nr:hypothetical protein PMZ80_011223 [Knufia obscura]